MTDPADNVRRGDCGPAVEQIQASLVNRWGATIAVDGSFGRNTEAAVIAFQTDVGLEPDGIVGELTWIALTNDDYDPAEA